LLKADEEMLAWVQGLALEMKLELSSHRAYIAKFSEIYI
jgi:hypothetical protein